MSKQYFPLPDHGLDYPLTVTFLDVLGSVHYSAKTTHGWGFHTEKGFDTEEKFGFTKIIDIVPENSNRVVENLIRAGDSASSLIRLLPSYELENWVVPFEELQKRRDMVTTNIQIISNYFK